MLEALVLAVLAILALCAVVAIPLLLIGAVAKVLLFFLLLPFKILKGILAAVAGVALGVGKLFLVFVFLLVAAGLALGAVLLGPLLVLFLFGGAVWLLARAFRSRPHNGPVPVGQR
jgi:hypothetical protein